MCGMIQAQTWCPPGAVWEDNVVGWAWEGCETRTYTGDTLIGGQLCQTLHVWKRSYSHLSQETTTAEYDHHTRIEDGVVYILWQSDGTWYEDTLYWLTAPVGARWNVAGAEVNCPAGDGWVEVLSIEDREINGLVLQVRHLAYQTWTEEMGYLGELIDRVGVPLLFIPAPCYTSEVSGIHVSYRDDLWDGFETGATTFCELFPNAIHEADSDALIELFPNPASEAIRLSLPQADLTTTTISLRDAIGRSAPVRLDRIGQNLILDVSGLPVGLYTISVAVHGQPVTSARVMVAR